MPFMGEHLDLLTRIRRIRFAEVHVAIARSLGPGSKIGFKKSYSKN